MAKIIKIDDFNKDLESYVQSGNLNFIIGSGASMPAVELMGNIEGVIDDLLLEEKDFEADSLALEFIQNLEEQSSIKNIEINSKLDETINNYVNFISIIDKILFERKNLILPRQANIFTTNYDVFVEFACTKIPSLILNDGFDRASSIENRYRFSPEKFSDRTYRAGSIYMRQSEIPTVNLLKMHGSINWARSGDEIVLSSKAPTKLTPVEMTSHVKLSGSLSTRAMVLPNVRKFGKTLIDRIYYDILRFFANSMEKENSVFIVFGFSFADSHILDITRRSLRNPTSQLIVYAYDSSAAESMANKFKAQRNVIVIKGQEGEVIDFEVFNKHLNNVIPERLKGYD